MKTKLITLIMIMLFLASISVVVFEAAAAGVELAYDNGECSQAYPAIHSGQYLRQRFLVSDFGISDDCLIETVRIFFVHGTTPDFTGVIKLRDYETGDVVAGAGLAYIPYTSPGQWYDYDVSGAGFVSDHFYVELWQTSPSGSGGLLCQDTDGSQGVSECSTNLGETWIYWGGNDFLIRAIVTPISAPATIDIDPDMLILMALARARVQRSWINAYIELPSAYNVADINVASIELSCDITGGVSPYVAGVDPYAPTEIGDYDGDGAPDLMVKFDKLALVDYLKTYSDADGMFYDLPMTITGTVGGTPFEGTDTISVFG